MDLYASLMVTLVCLSTTFAGCPDKCTCIKERVGFFGEKDLSVHCANLHRIPLEVITNHITGLVLSENNITVLPNIDQQVENIMTLTSLDLSFNNMSQLEVNSLRVFTNLTNLDLSHNNITSIPNGLFQTLPNLERVLLKNNPNLQLPENGFGTKALWSLNIAYCNLEEIPLKFFDSMPLVKFLYLQGNRISVLGPHLISAFQKMKIINLEDNKLTVLQPELISLPKIHPMMIRLEGNAFLCDCQFKDSLQHVPYMSCVVPPGSNNNNDNVDQEVYLNRLNCDVSESVS